MKKLFWIALSLLLVTLGAATLTTSCGPQKKFCPQTQTGECPEPVSDSGAAGSTGNGDSIVILD